MPHAKKYFSMRQAIIYCADPDGLCTLFPGVQVLDLFFG